MSQPEGEREREPVALDLEGIRRRCEAATEGPWAWEITPSVKAVTLRSRPYGGRVVMDFVRWGMDKAAPRFLSRHDNGLELMHRADEFAVVEKGREHHAAWHRLLAHPDAEFIAHAREDIPAMYQHIRRLEAEIARLRALTGEE